MTAVPSPRYLSPSGWNALLPTHEGHTLDTDMTADLIVVGAGYTGLAAARRWALLRPEAQVLVLDALTLGEGNPGRNSGFLLEVAMAEDADASAISRLGRCNQLLAETMAEISTLVAASELPCELVRRGTYRAAVGDAARRSLAGYRRFLDAAELPYAVLDREALAGAYWHPVLRGRPLLTRLPSGSTGGAHSCSGFNSAGQRFAVRASLCGYPC